jgi:dTDP-4-amino-4,6-dideoxygalactose transaminase
MTNSIPFNKPTHTGKEFEYVAETLRSGLLSGDGPFTEKCERFLENELGVRRVLLTSSCTHALEMVALLLDLQPGDEIIAPAFTYVSTANAFALRGAKPVFADICPGTLNIDHERLEQHITGRTKAIVVVHYAGVGCEMDSILEIARRRRVAVVEDNAHGLFGRYRQKYLGTFGCLSTLSFHETKNISCGEGGALLINDSRYIERAEIIRKKGTNRSHFDRGQVDRYTWIDLGSSYLMSDILAAVLWAQLEVWHSIQEARKLIWDWYQAKFYAWASNTGIGTPDIPPHCTQSYHSFYFVMQTPERQRDLIRYLSSQQVLGVSHYQPLHLSKMGRQYGGTEGACPIAESVSARILRLPFYTALKEEQQCRIAEVVQYWSSSY